MKAKYHVLSALPLGAGYYFYSGSPGEALTAAAAAVLVDADHILDYIVTQKRLGSLNEMARAFESFRHIHKNYFLLHSWELVLAFALITAAFPNRFAFAALTGYAFHVLIDQIYNVSFLGRYNLKSAFYFLTYRISKKFDVFKLRQQGDRIDINDEIY